MCLPTGFMTADPKSAKKTVKSLKEKKSLLTYGDAVLQQICDLHCSPKFDELTPKVNKPCSTLPYFFTFFFIFFDVPYAQHRKIHLFVF